MILVAAVLTLAALTFCLIMSTGLPRKHVGFAERVRAELAVNSAAVIVWPLIALSVARLLPSLNFTWFAIAYVIVFAYLVLEISPPLSDSKSLYSEETSDAWFQRSQQISTVIFSVGMLLLAQKHDSLVRAVAPIVFGSLLLCVLPCIPTISTRRGMSKLASVNALQKVSVTLSGGLLVLALAACMQF